LDILNKLEELVAQKLPDIENIKHNGYLIISNSSISRAKSIIYKKVQRKRQLSKDDITKNWRSIQTQISKMNNLADCVLVLSKVSVDIYDHNPECAKSLLEKANQIVDNIPSVVDRINGLNSICDSWVFLREKTEAQFLLEKTIDLIVQLNDISFEDRLKMVVQTAYQLDHDFADELVARLDTRLPESEVSKVDQVLQIQKLIDSPSKINSPKTNKAFQEAVLIESATSLLKNLVAERGSVPPVTVLEDWLLLGVEYNPVVYFRICEWVVESLCRSSTSSTIGQLAVMLETAKLINELAKWSSPAIRDGVPKEMLDSFPGLKSRYVIFTDGEIERSRTWLSNWLKENARDYVYICDPYFDFDQLEFLRFVPEDCQVLIVTTDNYLDVSRGIDHLHKQLEIEWRRITSNKFPSTQFTIVPKALEHRFHDRAIVTLRSGLDIGPSLNTLGKSYCKLAVLTDEEAKDLEINYIEKMLSQATWFRENKISPTILLMP